MRIGILELLTESVSQTWGEHLYNLWYKKILASITPQAVAAWCRQLGHHVYYATYYGQRDPKSLLPDQLDMVFISTYTQASALAYALSKLYRREKTVTVIGGRHANSFPVDCLRFFDFVVRDCDKTLLRDLFHGAFRRGTILTSGRLLEDLPSVAERMPEIRTATFTRGRPTMLSNVPLLSSVGCPYRCDFCIDWNNPYILLPPEHLANDLRYLSTHLPGMLVGFHDPNFGVKFDQVLEVMETIPAQACMRRLPFVWPMVFIPIPYGGTPLYDSYRAEDRILKPMPFSFYYLPYLVVQLKHYSPLEYYEKMVDLYAVLTSTKMLVHRVWSTRQYRLKLFQAFRTFAMRTLLAKLRHMRDQLGGDRQLRAFHEGTSHTLPAYYRYLYTKQLGAYAELISETDMYPDLA